MILPKNGGSQAAAQKGFLSRPVLFRALKRPNAAIAWAKTGFEARPFRLQLLLVDVRGPGVCCYYYYLSGRPLPGRLMVLTLSVVFNSDFFKRSF